MRYRLILQAESVRLNKVKKNLLGNNSRTPVGKMWGKSEHQKTLTD